MTGERVAVHGAGRTDAGVHALGQVAHVDLERDWTPLAAREATQRASSSPHPIAVLDAERGRPTDFDARRSASRCATISIASSIAARR